MEFLLRIATFLILSFGNSQFGMWTDAEAIQAMIQESEKPAEGTNQEKRTNESISRDPEPPAPPIAPTYLNVDFAIPDPAPESPAVVTQSPEVTKISYAPPPPPPPPIRIAEANSTTGGGVPAEGVEEDSEGTRRETMAVVVPHDRTGIRDNGANKLYVHTQAEVVDSGSDLACDGKRGSLFPIYAKSKYFADYHHRYTHEEAKEVCDENQLILGELESLQDHRSVQYFINYQVSPSGFHASDYKYFIGLNDMVEEGEYVRGDRQPFSFQTYHLSQPDDKDGIEDCTALGKEDFEGPVGMSDEDCKKRFHVICMFPPDSLCLNDTVEAASFNKLWPARGIVPLDNLSRRSYFVSNFQLPWESALTYCKDHSMTLFDMDDMVTMQYFRTLMNWENNFAENVPIPTIQYWTAGRFKGRHMNADVFWHREHKDNIYADYRTVNNFTYSGVFRWSSKKMDPGGLHYDRKDLCFSFGFESKPDPSPFVRNTNCDIPALFICAKDNPSHEKDSD